MPRPRDVVCVTLVADARFYGDPRYDKADARGARAFVRAEGAPAHVIVVGQLGRAVDYYTRGSSVTWQGDCTGPLEAPASAVVWIASGRNDATGSTRRHAASTASPRPIA